MKEGLGTIKRLLSGMLVDWYEKKCLMFLKMFLRTSMGIFPFHYQV